MEALNHHLRPAPVAITACARVDDAFHARFSARERRYTFRLVARRAESGANEYWTLKHLEPARGERIQATLVELEPRPFVRLEETLLERPLPGLEGVEPGQRLEVTLRRVEARSALLVLEP